MSEPQIVPYERWYLVKGQFGSDLEYKASLDEAIDRAREILTTHFKVEIVICDRKMSR